jgi:hypothetical protein
MGIILTAVAGCKIKNKPIYNKKRLGSFFNHCYRNFLRKTGKILLFESKSLITGAKILDYS